LIYAETGRIDVPPVDVRSTVWKKGFAQAVLSPGGEERCQRVRFDIGTFGR